MMLDNLRYIFVGDDFTGASDTLATLARAGKRVRLFLDVPSLDDVADLDAFGIATDARALGNDETKALMGRIGNSLAAHRPTILHYKICSTFDSSPNIGNFVTATDQLCQMLDISDRAIIGGQPSLGRYCIFCNLFARASDGKIYRIDRHPVMRMHPVTPMVESDLCKHYVNMAGGEIHLSNRQNLELMQDAVTLFDVMEASDLTQIGRVLRQTTKPLLCIGASSVAQAVFGTEHKISPLGVQKFDGPVLAFVGSRSSLSRDQVERASAYSKISVEPEGLENNGAKQRAITLLAQNKNVLIHLKEGSVNSLNARDIAQASARLVANIISHTQIGVLAVAGGDTSSAIVQELAPQSLSCVGDIDPGTPLCLANFTSGKKLPIILKGGQVGRLNLFDFISQGLV